MTELTDTADTNVGSYGCRPVINPDFETNPCEPIGIAHLR